METDYEQGTCGVGGRPLSLDGVLPLRVDRPNCLARVHYSDRRRFASLRTLESLNHGLPLSAVLDRALEISREIDEWLNDAGVVHDSRPHREVVDKEQDGPAQ
jgi:hypothetical protein